MARVRRTEGARERERELERKKASTDNNIDFFIMFLCQHANAISAAVFILPCNPDMDLKKFTTYYSFNMFPLILSSLTRIQFIVIYVEIHSF